MEFEGIHTMLHCLSRRPLRAGHKLVIFLLVVCVAAPVGVLAQTIAYLAPGSAPGGPQNPTAPTTVTQNISVAGNCGNNPPPPTTTTGQASERVFVPFAVQGVYYSLAAKMSGTMSSTSD
jgi:hypothetical protein